VLSGGSIEFKKNKENCLSCGVRLKYFYLKAKSSFSYNIYIYIYKRYRNFHNIYGGGERITPLFECSIWAEDIISLARYFKKIESKTKIKVIQPRKDRH